MDKQIPLETLIRIYKAKPGDTVDGKYVRMHGQVASQGIEPDEATGITNYSITLVYSFTFKDLTDGLFWYYSRVLEPIAGTVGTYDVKYSPLFTRESEIDPMRVYFAPTTKRTVTGNEPQMIYS